MRRLNTSIEDHVRGVVTIELDNGERLCVDAKWFREVGLRGVAKHLGAEGPTGRLPVTQDGRRIGSVPADFDPLFMKSKSWLYEPRPGDFVREGDGWTAHRMLGPGDIEAVPGFAWDEQRAPAKTPDSDILAALGDREQTEHKQP